MQCSRKFRRLVITLIVGWLALFVLLPNLIIVLASLLTRDETTLIKLPFTWENYARLCDPLYVSVIVHSLFMATVATILCLLIGYPFAMLIARQPKKRQRFMILMVIIPFWTNSLVRTYALKLLIGTKGVLNTLLLTLGLISQPLKILYTPLAVVLGLVYILLPFMVLPLYAALEKLDNTYLEAARDLGASPRQIFMRIILPLTTPGIIGGCVLVFLPAMGMFYVSDLLGGAKNLLIGNIIKSQFLNARDWPFGAATSVALTLLMGLLLLLYYRIRIRISRMSYPLPNTVANHTGIFGDSNF